MNTYLSNNSHRLDKMHTQIAYTIFRTRRKRGTIQGTDHRTGCYHPLILAIADGSRCYICRVQPTIKRSADKCRLACNVQFSSQLGLPQSLYDLYRGKFPVHLNRALPHPTKAIIRETKLWLAGARSETSRFVGNRRSIAHRSTCTGTSIPQKYSVVNAE